MMNKKVVLKFLLFFLSALIFTTKANAQIEPIQVGTTTRQMLVYAPPAIEQGRPLLISMHGMNQDINYQKNQAKWEEVAKANNFVVVYPAGINNSWDISGNRDIDFILAIIDEMSKRYDIDRDRVYLSGFSMGGMMTYHAATKIADKIAAFAPVSGYLMGGPNTSSSRPIPIIHTHGTSDDVVAYSGVQRCMDAWITRNKCPKTAEIIKPYPAGKASSNATLYTWGPGTDSVSIVLLSLKGVGHWHSIDANGVNTSQEIWNFCKNYSLGFGVPKLKRVALYNENPKQIVANFSLPIIDADSFSGFSIKVNNELVEIEDVVLTDSLHLAINLTDSISADSEISISYQSGNVLSVYEKQLEEFNDKFVDNLLYGAPPRIIKWSVSENGDSLIAGFNKKMLLPNVLDSFRMSVEYDSVFHVSLEQCTYLNNDSSMLVFSLGQKVYADYELFLSYTGANLMAADSGLVRNFTDVQINNTSKGLPMQIVSGTLETSSVAIVLEFSKAIKYKEDQINQLSILANGVPVPVKEAFASNNQVRLVLKNNAHFGDTITVSYSPGTIVSADRGELVGFSDFLISNPLTMPVWHEVPGKVEAENYALQFGTDLETAYDTGGGQNVGWIEDADWLEYAIDNSSEETAFKISFRLAAESAGKRLDYFIDNVRAGFVNVPSTSGWQNWRSVEKDIVIPKGKHYLKFVATIGGFNINYFDIYKESVGINNFSSGELRIYPNPASDKIIIRSTDFDFNHIELRDVMGRSVLEKAVPLTNEHQLPVNLPDGIYLVKIKNESKSLTMKIQVSKQ